jgi:predicted transcriptional regulator
MNSTDLDLIERFISAYNAIDFHLETALGEHERSSFRTLVDLFAKRHRWWKDAEKLRVFASLRNVVIHDKVEPYQYVCVPTNETVEAIEAIRDRLAHPERADRKFLRPVLCLDASDSLRYVLTLMHEKGFSHFPVYAGQQFSGVLTPNGITRYLAHHAAKEEMPLNLDEVEVRYVLAREESRPNYFFAPRDEPIEKIAFSFHENTYLEAVLLTEHGGKREKLLGIATRADVLNLDI